jgi:hypothetical protein
MQKYIILISLIVLNSCNSLDFSLSELFTPHKQARKEPIVAIDFSTLPKIPLDVSSVDVINLYHCPLTHPHVEHLFPESLIGLVRKWSERIKVTEGSPHTLRISINEASAVEEDVYKVDAQNKSTGEAATVYKAKLKVGLEIFNNNDFLLPKSRVDFSTHASRGLTKNASADEHEYQLYKLSQEIIDRFNLEMETAIPKYFMTGQN